MSSGAVDKEAGNGSDQHDEDDQACNESTYAGRGYGLAIQAPVVEFLSASRRTRGGGGFSDGLCTHGLHIHSDCWSPIAQDCGLHAHGAVCQASICPCIRIMLILLEAPLLLEPLEESVHAQQATHHAYCAACMWD